MTDPASREAAIAPEHAYVLAINGGSSSIKFGLFDAAALLRQVLDGEVGRIGLPRPTLRVDGKLASQPISRIVAAPDHAAAAGIVADAIRECGVPSDVIAVGHRVVHGGPKYGAPQRISPEMVEELRRLRPFDPEHLPDEILLIEAFSREYPRLPQVACFDTAFHHDMPRVAQMLPIPRRYEAQGLRRYGFHGLSYAFLMDELARVAGPDAARGRIILAHLGSGASLAAVRDGRSIDTSMGLTPAAGIPMSTRSGDLDPGLLPHLARTEGMTPEKFGTMVNFHSGLLGVSETSSDMRDLVARETQDVRAAEAVALFCYQVRKWIGGFAAVLGGVDTLVFAGGIGEHAPVVRARICEGLGFLGIGVDPSRNAQAAPLISPDGGAVHVRVMRTNEALMIARSVASVLNRAGP